MNTFVLHTTLVCLAIILSVMICNISGSTSNTTDFKNVTQVYVMSNTLHAEGYNHPPGEKKLKMEIYGEKCRINSHRNNTLKILLNEIQELYSCLMTHNITYLLDSVTKTDTNTNRGSSIKELSKKLPTYHVCVQNYTSVLNECLNSDEQLSFAIAKNVSAGIEQFIFQNDGEHLMEFFTNGGESCFNDRNSTLQQCFSTLSNKDYFLKVKNYFKIIPEELFIHFKFNEEHCNDLREIMSCIVNDLKHCDQQTTANLIGTAIESALQKTPCSKFTTPVV